MAIVAFVLLFGAVTAIAQSTPPEKNPPAMSDVSKVAGEVRKAEQIRVPAGTFETFRAVYRIEKSKGAETYEVLASKETPASWFAKIFLPEFPPNW
jgi:hypothetical protein